MDIEEKKDEMQLPNKGRAAFMEMYKTHHPDITDEPDEDTLFEYAGQGYGERDELRGKYDSLNSANEKLASAISEDPRFTDFIAMIGSGEKPLYALGKIFGNLIDQLDEEGTEQLKNGQTEYSSNFNQLKQNFTDYKARLKQYGEDTGKDDATLQKINDIILDLSEAFMNWDISTEMIDGVFKMIDYDSDKSAEIESEKLKARNDLIDEQKPGGAASTIPDMAGSRNQPTKPVMPVLKDEGYVPYAERLQVKK